MNNTANQPQGRIALVNGRVILPREVVTGKAVIIEGPKILGLDETASLGSDVEQVDVGGRFISPGLVDIHSHGALGRSFNEPTAEAFETITRENARRGVTAMLATPSTAPVSELVDCLEFSRQWLNQAHDGAQILGVHLEGPYFCMEQRGAQDPANILNPDDGTPDRLLEHHDIIKIMTYAPELPGALKLTERLAKLGVVPAAGHSCAKEEEVAAAIRAGLSHIIHIWSAQSTTIREGPWRKPGLLEVSLVYDNLTVEMISDNKHLPPTLMKLAYKCIGPDRLCVISDATSGAGLPEGSHFTMGHVEYEVYDGVGMVFDHSCFAGSTTLVGQMVPILVDIVGIPLVEVIRMASLTPLAVIGCADQKGSLTAGKDADLAIFEDDFSAWRTMIAGQWVHLA